MGHIRLGRIMEDMDYFAGSYVGFFLFQWMNSDENFLSSLVRAETLSKSETTARSTNSLCNRYCTRRRDTVHSNNTQGNHFFVCSGFWVINHSDCFLI